MYESAEENGISHFLEHVAIRNINFLMEGGLYRELDRLGLMFNACTYKEFIQFEITGAAKHIRRAINIFLKLFEPICLPVSEIDVERKRIKAEIREDDEKSSLAFFSGKKVWGNTSLSRPITGQSSQLDKMGKHRLQQAHKELFSPNNLFFYVTGHAEQQELEYLRQAAEECGFRGKSKTRYNLAPVPENFFCRNAAVYIKNSTDTLVRFSFDLCSKAYSQAAYMLLYDILFECESSKIHQELSEKYGYIYSFDAGMEQYSNVGNLYLQYEVQPARLTESVELVTALLVRLKEGVTDELDYVKAAYIDNGDLILDHAPNLNWAQAYEGHILEKSSPEPEQRKKEYAAVTPEELTELAREIFTSRNLVVTMKGKKSKKLEQQIREIIKRLS